MVFINAMGIRITEEQRALIQKAADRGLPVLSTAVTNPANDICSPPPLPCVPTWLAAEDATTAACWNMCAARWTAS